MSTANNGRIHDYSTFPVQWHWAKSIHRRQCWHAPVPTTRLPVRRSAEITSLLEVDEDAVSLTERVREVQRSWLRLMHPLGSPSNHRVFAFWLGIAEGEGAFPMSEGSGRRPVCGMPAMCIRCGFKIDQSTWLVTKGDTCRMDRLTIYPIISLVLALVWSYGMVIEYLLNSW